MEADALQALVEGAKAGDEEATQELVQLFSDPQARADVYRQALDDLTRAHGDNDHESAILKAEFRYRTAWLRRPEGTTADDILAEAAAFTSVCRIYIEAQTCEELPEATDRPTRGRHRSANSSRATRSFVRVFKELRNGELLPPKQHALEMQDELSAVRSRLFQARLRGNDAPGPSQDDPVGMYYTF